MRVLLAEDDHKTAEAIIDGLAPYGMTVVHADNGASALALAENEIVDIWVVDRMMPHVNGLELIEALRARGDRRPVLMLSAMSDVDDRVTGLRAGADDYLVKPFALDELVARLEVLSRRAALNATAAQQGESDAPPQTQFVYGPLALDMIERSAKREGQKIDLKPREFALLLYLLQNQGHVITRDLLLQDVFQLNFDPQTNLVDVHMSRLRGKIDRPFNRPLIHTIRGRGFMLEDRDAP